MNTQMPEWRQMDTIELPLTRFGGALVFNSKDQTVLLYGGINSSQGYLDDFWVTNGYEWKQQQTSLKPSARIGMSLSWDEYQQAALLFGGMKDNQLMGDTWLFDGNDWVSQHPLNSPSPRFSASMAYDIAKNQTILFGGKTYIGKNLLEDTNETWIWDGKEWHQPSLSLSPPARSGACLVYDNARQSMLLFGGGAGGGFLDDTWVWDGTIWIEQQISHRPLGRADFGMAYHPALQQTILFGGQSYGGMATDTWVWNGKEWIQLLTVKSPPIQVSYGNQLVYMPTFKAIVLYNAYREKTITSDTTFSVSEHSEFWILEY
jgi:hypothetical protein